MVDYIKNYCVVTLSEEKHYVLCKKEDEESIIKKVIEKFNVADDEVEDNVISYSLRDYVMYTFEDEEWKVEGQLTETVVSVDADTATTWLVDEFDSYFTEEHLNEICKKEDNVHELLKKTINDIGRGFLVEELQEMLDDAKEMK